ncbi:MAG: hypothetical protein AB9835_13870 [Eubacteriales bacterium]
MKKGIISAVLTVLMLLVLCSCSYGAYTTVMSVETNTSSEKAMKYEKFNGYKSYKFKVDEGEAVTVAVNFTSESGKLSAYIAKDNDKSKAVYEGNDIPTSEFTVNITESGEYTIRLDAENHKGSYFFKIKRD